MNNYSIYLIFCLSFLFSNSSDSVMNKNILPKQIVEANSDTTKSFIPEDVFIAQLEESKILLSDAIMSDITGDTLSAIFSFEKLFESLAIIDEIIEAKPTDGLWADNRSDEDQIGLNYKQIEEAMNSSSSSYYKKFLEIREQNIHKMKPIPVCKVKES